MSFYTSLSGLQAAQTDLSTISHNLANVSTTGFKKSRSEFADVMASSFTSDPRRMVGSGATLKENRQLFGEGNLITTGSSLDLAVSGDGFFAVKAPDGSGSVSYTRNGAFSVDTSRFIADAQGNRLQAHSVETDGTVPANATVGPVRIPETTGMAVATSQVALKATFNANAPGITAPFDRNNPATFTNATATTIYDANGNEQVLTQYLVRNPSTTPPGTPTTNASEWTVYSYLDEDAAAAPATATFNAAGVMITPNGPIAVNFAAVPGRDARSVNVNLEGSTSAKQPFAIASRSQDGQALGEFAGITVDSGGVISASYSNGDTLKLGKVALANFVNPTGLRQTGSSYWTATGLSGTAMMGSADQNGFGKLMSGTVEGSNVDITEELVELIDAQRNFQANAKALDTASQISQTIFNIRA